MGVRYMKIEIEIPDLEEIYYGYDDYDNLTGKDIKKIIADIAIEKFIDKMYDDYMNDKVYESVKTDVKEIVKSHSNDIVDRVVNIVSNEILKKKSIVNEMPKKSEIANISKEWQDYFIELIDKAIAKRFK
jgi:hypothetical protein